jgi:hypothetical protein
VIPAFFGIDLYLFENYKEQLSYSTGRILRSLVGKNNKDEILIPGS